MEGHRPGRQKLQAQSGRDRLPVPLKLDVENDGIARRVLNLDAPRRRVVRASVDDAVREHRACPDHGCEAAWGARLSLRVTSNDRRSRTAVDTRSARACPLVPTIAPPIVSSSSGSPPIRSAARLNPFVAVTPADVESTGKSGVPVRGITQNFALASAIIIKCS